MNKQVTMSQDLEQAVFDALKTECRYQGICQAVGIKPYSKEGRRVDRVLQKLRNDKRAVFSQKHGWRRVQ